MLEYYKVIKNFSQNISKDQILTIFYEFEGELDSIFAATSEPMVGILKMKWWEDSLIKIQEDKNLSLNPLLDQIKIKFNKEKLNCLIDLIQAKTYEVERYEFQDINYMMENYFKKIARVKSLILLQANYISPFILCIEIIKFLELLDLYSSQNWNFKFNIANILIENLIEESKKIKPNTRLENLFYKSACILIKTIKDNKFCISQEAFRMKLGFAMLFS